MPEGQVVAHLDRARDEIDRIDDRILELLAERARIVNDVAAAKCAAGREARSAFRPAREAQVLRRLSRRAAASGAPDAAGVLRIWREIMTAGLLQQAPVTVALPRRAGEEMWKLRRLAMQHFGSGCRMREFPDLPSLCSALSRDSHLLGVLPSLTEWIDIRRHCETPPSVIALLPAWGRGAEGAAAVAVGHAALEPSGEDVTLIRLAHASARQVRVCEEQLRARGVKFRRCVDQETAAVLEIDGFWADAGSLESLKGLAGDCAAEWLLLGVCARPIQLESEESAR